IRYLQVADTFKLLEIAPRKFLPHSGRHRQIFEKSLIKLCDELIYMLKTLIGSFNRDTSAQTSFDPPTERPKNRSQQVFPNHLAPPKLECMGH
ncbi:MAG TPA: hypothetical protein VF865_17475, partial [Acidobacteriaceae bacterium]